MHTGTTLHFPSPRISLPRLNGGNVRRVDFLTASRLCYSLTYGQTKGCYISARDAFGFSTQILNGLERVGRGPSSQKFAMPEIDHDFVEKVLAGDRLAIARAISAVENRHPSAVPLLRELFPRAGRARVVGLTGSPGAGKSTLAEKLAIEYRRRGGRIGILAVVDGPHLSLAGRQVQETSRFWPKPISAP